LAPGAIGELSHGSKDWTYKQLYSFCSQTDCADGRYPGDPPIRDAHGNLTTPHTTAALGNPHARIRSAAAWYFR